MTSGPSWAISSSRTRKISWSVEKDISSQCLDRMWCFQGTGAQAVGCGLHATAQKETENMPSFIHAALSGVRRANRPREIAENFIMALSHAREACWVGRHRRCGVSVRACKVSKSHAGSFGSTVRAADLGPPRPARFGMTGMEKPLGLHNQTVQAPSGCLSQTPR